MRPPRVGDRVSIRPDGKRGHGLGDVVAAGPVNVRVKPCGGGAEVTLRHAEAPVTTGQLWLDAHPDAERPTVQTGLAL